MIEKQEFLERGWIELTIFAEEEIRFCFAVGLAGGISGHRLAKEARAMRPGLKVLFITGHADEAEAAASDMTEGIEILPKPFQVRALVERVGAMLGGYVL